MAQIKKNEIAQEDIYGDITKSAKKLETQTDSSNASLAEQTKLVKELTEAVDNLSQKGIDTLIASRKKMEKVVDKSIDNDKKAIAASKALEKARLEEIRIDKAREKSIDDFNKKREKELAKSKKATEQEVKNADKKIKAGIKLQESREKAADKAEKDRQKTRLAEIKLAQDREKSFDKFEKGLRKEEAQRDRLEKAKKREIAQQKKINKINKEQSRVSARVVDRLKELKKEFTDVALAEGESSDAAKLLLSKIKELEARLSKVNKALGKTKKGTAEAGAGFKRLGTAIKASGIGLVIAAIAGIGSQFIKTREGALAFAKLINRVTAGVKVFATSTVEALSGIGEVFGGLFKGVSNFVERLGVELNIISSTIKGIFSDEEAEKLKQYREELEILENTSLGVSDGFKKVTSAFDNFNDRVEETIGLNDKLLDTTLEYTIAIEEQERSLVKLTKERELAAALSDDDTLGFQLRIDASKELARLNDEVAKAERDIAEKRLKLAEANIKAELAQSGIIVKTRREIIAILKDQDKALKVSDDASRQFTDSFIALGEAQTNAEVAQFDQRQRLRKIDSDLKERDLDIELDNFDNLKTINERKIANERTDLEERRRMQSELEELNDITFNRQIEILQTFTEKTIEGNKLVAQSNSTVLNEQIRALGLSEILEGRLLEVIRDRRSANMDLVESNTDLTASEVEANEVRKDLLVQEEALKDTTIKKLEELDEDRLENEIENTRERLDVVEDGSKEQLDLQQKLNDLLLDAQRTALDKELELANKRKDELREIGDAIFDGFIERSEKKQDAIDDEIAKSEELEDRLRTESNNQNAIASESLAAQEAIGDELLAQKEAEAKKEQALEEAKMIYAAINSFLDAGDSLPIATGKGFAGVFGIRKLIESLPGSFGGTEGRLGDESQAVMSGKDGHIVRVDSSEYIVNGGLVDQAEAAGITGTSDLVQKAIMYQQGAGGSSAQTAAQASSSFNTSMLEAKMDTLINLERNRTEFSLQPEVINGIVEGMWSSTKKNSVQERYLHLKK